MIEVVVRWSNDWGDCCPDNCIDKWFEQEVKNIEMGFTSINVATQTQLNKLRLENLLGNIKITKFIYEGKELTMNKLGDVGEWPGGFSDINFGLVCKILKTANHLRKVIRGE